MNGQVASATECPTPSAWHALWAGELTPEQLRALESHLDECAACAALIAITPPTPALIREAARDTASHVDTPDIWYLRMRTALLAESCSSPTIDMVEPEWPDAALAGTLPPSTIGDYELLERIGRGGMGIVFRARQVKLDRIVAVKTLHARTNQSPEAVERLIIEAKRLAQVRHPNIVQVFDVGEQDGVPFFSMELIEGTTVARAAREGSRWAPRRAAVLVAKIADAVHAAHEVGIIHRDLKPANVLLAAGDEPKITDFGLALTRADTAIGGPRLVAGTAEYMAPEQWAGELELITLQTDIYGIGTILYELLAGKPPFPRDRNLIKTRQRVLNDDPKPLSNVPRDLESICLRCLEKTPDQRYTSAQAVADDLRRFLHHRPVSARPADLLTRLSYACRRNWPQLATAVAILLVAAALVVPHLVSQARALRVGVANSMYVLGDAEARHGRIDEALAYFDRALTELPSDQPIWRRFYEQTRARWAMLANRDTKTLEHIAAVTSSCVSPNGRRVLIGDATGGVTLWSPSDGSIRSLGQGSVKIQSMAFNRGGTRCAAGYDDGTARVWDTSSGALITECRAGNFAVDAIAFLGDGNEFVTNTASVTGKILTWSTGTSPAKQIGSGEKLGAPVSALVASPDGISFVVLGHGGRCWLCDNTGNVKRDLALLAGQISAAAYSPEGARIVVAGAALQWFDLRTEQLSAKSPPIAGSARRIVVRNDGGVSAIIEDGEGKLLRQFTPDLGSFDDMPIDAPRATLALDGNGDALLLATGEANRFRLARVPALGRRSISLGETAVAASVSVSNDGRRIATFSQPAHTELKDRRFQIAVWNGASLEQTAMIRELPNGAFAATVAQDPESPRIAIGCESGGNSHGEVFVGHTQPDGSIAVQQIGTQRTGVTEMAFAPGGRLLYSASPGVQVDPTSEIVCWDAEAGVERGRVTFPAPVYALAVSPDGRWLAVGSTDGQVTLLSADTLDRAGALPFIVGAPVSALAFSSDGAHLACGTSKGRVVVLKRDDHRLTRACEPIAAGASVSATRFGADPRLLYVTTIQRDAGVTAWNTDTGRPVGPPFPVPGVIRDCAVPKTGSAIICLTTDGRLTMIPLTPAFVAP